MSYFERKKRAFLNLVNSVKGFVRTITGTPPLTLPDCVDNDSLINYSIMGNCVQDGTPTTENPVEVKCVGEKTKNLCDSEVFANWIISNGGWYETNLEYAENRSCVVFSSNTMHNKYVPELFAPKEATQYTWSMDIKGGRNSPTQGALVFGFVYTDNTTTNVTVTWNNTEFTRVSATSTAGKTVKSLRISYTTASWWAVDLDSIQVEEGTQTDYEPFGKYKIPIVASGKNLYKNVEIIQNKYINSSGVETSSESLNRTDYCEVSPNADYIYKCLSYVNNIIAFSWYDENKTFIERTSFSCTANVESEFVTKSPSNARYAICNIIVYSTNIFISKLETTNIYLDEPLNGIYNSLSQTMVGEDTIDYENSVVKREVACVKDDGNKFGGYYFAKHADYFHTVLYTFGKCPDVLILPETGSQDPRRCVVSNVQKFRGYTGVGAIVNSVSIGYRGGYSQNICLGLPYGTFGVTADYTDAQFQTAYKNYVKDNPITYYYIRNKVEEQPIKLPKLPTFKGTTIYTVDTETQPSNMSATYYSTRKGE